MPIPGGAYALQQSLSFYPAVNRDSRRRSNSLGTTSTCHEDDPDYEEYKQAQKHFSENLKVTMAFYQNLIPSTLGKVTGVMVLEAKEYVEHSGMFILMKGLSIPPKKRLVRATGADGGGPLRRPVTSLKFTVLGNVSGQGEELLVEAGSKESYPLELEMPESWDDLPPPLVTPDGKLKYQLQAFMSTSEGRHVNVGETSLHCQGYYNLSENLQEIQKPIKILQQVQSKRSYLGLGRKKTVNVELTVEKRGFLPHENVNFFVVGRGQDNKTQVQLECKVELIQKVWYQVLSKVGKRLSVRMKVNLIAVTSMNELMVEPGKEIVWEGRLLIPREQTPTYKFDFVNSISYTLKVSFALNGDREGKVTGEAPIYIGTEHGVEERVRDKEKEGAGSCCRPTIAADDEEEDDISLSRFGASSPLRPSQSMTFTPRRRAGSISSVESFQSQSTTGSSSLFRMPPSYSQLSSRRSTLETLPPPYCELELQEKCFVVEDKDETSNCEEEETSASQDNVDAAADELGESNE